MKSKFHYLFLSLATILVCQVSNAQSVELQWKMPLKVLQNDGNEVYQLHFQGAQHLAENNYLASYAQMVNGSVDHASIVSFVSEPVTPTEAVLLPGSLSNISPIIRETKFNSSSNSQTLLSIIPFYINSATNEAMKVTSFVLQVDVARTAETRTVEGIETNTTSSVLSSGKWRKLGITSDGVYKIDKDLFQSFGFSAASDDPRNIRIYGNGGGMLPQANSDFRYDDLEENHIIVVGESDGKFDNGDYILFYAQGPHEIVYDETSQRFEHEFNVYSDTNYYFITVADSAGLRIPDGENLATKSSNVVSTFNEYFYHESDETNVLGSGREWYGESFKFYDEHNFSFSLTGAVAGQDLELTSVLMAQSRIGSTSFTLRSGNTLIGTQSLAKSTSSTYGIKGRQTTVYFDIAIDDLSSSSSLPIKITYDDNGDNAAEAYVNKLGLNFERTLAHHGSQIDFVSLSSTEQPTCTYEIASINSNAQIWDISNPEHPVNQLFATENGKGVFTTESDTLKRFILLSGSSFKTPSDFGRVSNQDLHGITTSPELLIVTHPKFKSMAEELATFKRDVEGYTVALATTGQVYNEFSSGKQDVSAIRDFAKMLYSRSSGDDRLRFLLLVGDCSYDYKNREDKNNNYVPIYESYESLHNVQTYSSDDYFGFLDNSEGSWAEVNSGNHIMDIGIGRFPVNDQDEANTALSKLKDYVSSQDAMDKWRNTVCYVADDGDGVLHMDQANDLSNQVNATYPQYNTTKIFLDAYEQVSSAGGEIAPVVNTELDNQVDKGALIVNYTGHGAEEVWAQEKILTVQQAQNYDNYDRLPLFVTATCEFGRYDDPKRASGAELLFSNASGGGIALVTTTRPVYASSNFALNKSFYNEVFKPKADGTMPTLGEIMIETKNNSLNGVFNRNFSLLGDPSMRLAYPKKNIYVETINGDSTSLSSDTISALGVVTITGYIEDYDGTVDTDFDGQLFVTIYDKESVVNTLGNEEGNVFSFTAQNNVLYEGVASVIEGKYSVSFVVPKDISYQFDYGKISFYAKHNDEVDDANGYYDNIIIGGTDRNAPIDNTPPVVKLYMDDTTFVNGGTTGTEALFMAHIVDDNGVNIASTGIGHEITAYLDDNDDEIIILNNFYTSEIDSYTSGWVTYDFDELSPGKHTITFKVWDTHNNSTEETIEFWVGDDFSISNYPNPFSESTTFEIDQARPGESVEVFVTIMDSHGAVVREIGEYHSSGATKLTLTPWEGDDISGNKLSTGIYFYRVTLRYESDGYTASKNERLVVIN